MRTRKELKRTARAVLKEHYGLFVILCLLAAIIGSEFAGTLYITQTKTDAYIEQNWKIQVNTLTDTAIFDRFMQVMTEMALGNEEEIRRQTQEKITRDIEKSKENQKAVIGRSRGAFSYIVNHVTSGAVFISMVVALRSMIGSNDAAIILLILAGLLLYLAVYIFGIETYRVVMRRMFLEGMRYDTVYTNRALFLLNVKKWCQASVTLLLTGIYELLWSLTIVGGIMKRYSYFLVPYIVAENPGIKANQAITLSRKMMNGHKWECFILELSFVGWEVLGWLTLGISNIVYLNPYKISVVSEYYADLRRQAKEKNIRNAKLLIDTWLFERPEEELLREAYADVIEENEQQEEFLKKWKELSALRRFLAKTFGLTFGRGKEEKFFEEYWTESVRLFYAGKALEGETYPERLSAVAGRHRRSWIGMLNYARCYSVWSLILLFFSMSFVGWLWEVSLHLIVNGVFVNRGVMHGPWLPIYGCGSVLILLVLNRFRRNPGLLFLLTVALCGAVEYGTSCFLEILHGGTMWWNYSGYFLNLNGRICAEGLLVFGLGGMVIVYLLAPLLDTIFRRIPHRILIMILVVLLGAFTADNIYSAKYPNTGEGITSYTGTP